MLILSVRFDKKVNIENIDPNEVRQFSKRPFLEIKTDFPDLPMLEIPLRVDASARSDLSCVNDSDGVQQELCFLCQYDDISYGSAVALRGDLCYTAWSKEKQS